MAHNNRTNLVRFTDSDTGGRVLGLKNDLLGRIRRINAGADTTGHDACHLAHEPLWRVEALEDGHTNESNERLEGASRADRRGQNMQ